ncbi:enoyl-CoA hydratase/isomerase family protein [Rhizobium tumorigenes]|uniref:3-hydroxyisobutyryl-CoA hydrolase n=1 Tax=Rhizobium tumorigenes TaxID=2041385 RepID=A0AAF1KU95_9HYPH|nr:enoyl-CoA hydratase/isomerase family protein [Rhizobium tumorigenes]WFR95756.1 enoyl-CoA hydratase/isomerase family protein [Rhizobium tumorigenes]
MQAADEIIIERNGSVGVIRLNRPKALNSLTLSMVRAIASSLESFAADPAIASVAIMGEGERGLCAGGDIRALHQSGSTGGEDATSFWREEFRLNRMIAEYPKPYVALMDGITMGGGVGIASHGSHRIVTERTRLAMPETGIGYFPDVGATWLLSRDEGETGTWLALTGLAIGAADAIYAGLADHHVSSQDLDEVIAATGRLPPGASAEEVHSAIAAFATPPEDGVFGAKAGAIGRAFAHDSIEAIMAALAMEPDAFAADSLKAIATRSPTSLKLTLLLLRAGRKSRDLAECLERELCACRQILKTPDFYEGIRAAIIDKDRNPQWSPESLDAVDEAALERFLEVSEPALFDR